MRRQSPAATRRDPGGCVAEIVCACRMTERRTGLTRRGGVRVIAFPRLEESLNPEVKLAERVQARVQGPHAGERLRHLADGFFHCTRACAHVGRWARCDQSYIGRQRGAGWARDRQGDVAQVRAQSVGLAKLGPDAACGS
jgi:hypothetical protein